MTVSENKKRRIYCAPLFVSYGMFESDVRRDFFVVIVDTVLGGVFKDFRF